VGILVPPEAWQAGAHKLEQAAARGAGTPGRPAPARPTPAQEK